MKGFTNFAWSTFRSKMRLPSLRNVLLSRNTSRLLALGITSSSFAYLKTQTDLPSLGHYFNEPTSIFADEDPLTSNLQTIEACSVSDLAPGQMKEIVVGPDPKKDTVVLANVDGEFHCVGSKCSHFGAPLAKGILFGDRVFCPWHLASFSVITGFPDFGPVFDGLPVYKTEVKNGKVFITVPTSRPSTPLAVPTVNWNTQSACSNEHFVIVGGGPAGMAAAETLRQSGFTGRITMVSKEAALPYDRTILSKNLFGVTADKIKIRDQKYFDDNQIERVNALANGLDTKSRTVTLQNGQSLKYDKVLIATGLRPNPHSNFSKQSKNVFYLREATDNVRIQGYFGGLESTPRNIVVIGGGFVGFETAGAVKSKYKEANVTVVTRSHVYSGSLGKDVGQIFQTFAEKNGVQFKTDETVKSVKYNAQGKVEHSARDN